MLLAALIWYAALSLLAFAAFAIDKSRVQRPGARRIPERTLHILSGLGGFPGSFLAMALVHHKNRKLPFIVITLILAAAHLACWLAWRCVLAPG